MAHPSVFQMQKDISELRKDVYGLIKTNRAMALRHLAVERTITKGGLRALRLLASGKLLVSIQKEEVEIVKETQAKAAK